MKKHFTIGLAGHIDHGKTSLTKALTNVDTDILKEEKERAITIELGFAPLIQNESLQISIIDVPGHERFIKRMIAGVSGIDFALLIVAADEGVMPQTKEHLEILDFLGIQGGMVVITKINLVDEDLLELAKEEIKEELEATIFKDSPIFMVDSLTGEGIQELKEAMIEAVKKIPPRDYKGYFRLPVDSVFTIKGQGTVVRGTVNEGSIEEGQTLWILPEEKETKARQIQVHHQEAKQAFAGQRTAINLMNVSKDEVKRGDVLVSDFAFSVTDVIDVSIRMVKDLEYVVKQRMPIVCYIGTSEVRGRVVFFDRNEIKEESEEILCQLRLEEKVVTKRGDVLILRRPTPSETIGGGWVIDPNGKKYRFGTDTIQQLSHKKEGTEKERFLHTLKQNPCLSLADIQKLTELRQEDIKQLALETNAIIEFVPTMFVHQRTVEDIKEEIYDHLLQYEKNFSMRKGIPKAELLQKLTSQFPKTLIEYCLDDGMNELWNRKGIYVFTLTFQPSIPKEWETRVNNVIKDIKNDQLEVNDIYTYLQGQGVPDRLFKDIIQFLIEENLISPLDDRRFFYLENFQKALHKLQEGTESTFSVGEAKEILGLSRKYMIPFLEKLDRDGFTERIENERKWK
ncbi:selenocysteine-specific translation elongation factor [Bacillus massiliigorillae]|uniref:selenocysteine-specific translation elongation factor n=1 Tax=Bacillus massiliigorillae TaxID=1243664 RepID=UPI0003A28AEA|nr:selenocysteine-specific translation elongation factor [Bacillus massiliigorillae]